MTINILDTLEVKQFEAEVHQVFQEKGNVLRQATRFRNIQGNKTQFPVLGKLQAAERIVGTPVVTSNQSATAVVVTTTKFSVAQYTDIFLGSEVNFDAKGEAAESVAMAMGRKLDQVIIDALDAATFTKTVASGSDNLNVSHLANSAKQLNEDGVPRSDRFLIAHTNGEAHLVQETDVKTIDSNTIKTLTAGAIGSFYGYNFLFIGNNADEDGLPLATNDRSNWALHKSALGLALGMDFRIEINYVPEMAAHLVAGFFSAGSEVIDETGIVEITTDES